MFFLSMGQFYALRARHRQEHFWRGFVAQPVSLRTHRHNLKD